MIHLNFLSNTHYQLKGTSKMKIMKYLTFILILTIAMLLANGVAQNPLKSIKVDGKLGDIKYSLDGTGLALMKDKGIWIYDAKTLQELVRLKGAMVFTGGQTWYSADGQTFAAWDFRSTVTLWDVSTGENTKTLTLTGHPDEIWRVWFSPDGRSLASQSVDGTFFLWDVVTGKNIKILTDTDRVRSVSFSPNGLTLAIHELEDDIVSLWDVVARENIIKLRGQESYLFSPEGNTFASGSENGIVSLWDVVTGENIKTIKGHRHSIDSVSFSPDGNILASKDTYATIRLWDVSTGKNIKTLRGRGHTDSRYSRVSFLLDGRTLVSEGDAGTVSLWDVSTGENIKTLTLTEILGVENKQKITFEYLWTAGINLQFSPNGRTLTLWGREKSSVGLWDVAKGEYIKMLTPPGGIESRWRKCSLSPDGRTLASVSFDGVLSLWELIPNIQ